MPLLERRVNGASQSSEYVDVTDAFIIDCARSLVKGRYTITFHRQELRPSISLATILISKAVQAILHNRCRSTNGNAQPKLYFSKKDEWHAFAHEILERIQCSVLIEDAMEEDNRRQGWEHGRWDMSA